MHPGVGVGVLAKAKVAGLEQPPVDLRLHERALIGSQVVSEANHVDQVAQMLAHLGEGGEVSLQQGVEKALHLLRLDQDVDEEVVETPQERSPLEQVTADHHHDGAVGLGPQPQGVGPHRRPEVGPAGVVPGRMDERRPENLAHGLVEARPVGRPAVGVGEAGLVEEGGAGGHPGDERAVPVVDVPRAVRLGLGVEPDRVLGRLSRGEHHVVPVLVPGVERASQIDHVDPEPVERPGLGLGQLLDDVVDADVPAADPEPLPHPRIGGGGDARAGGGAQVDGHAVGLAVGDGGQHPFTGRHGGLLRGDPGAQSRFPKGGGRPGKGPGPRRAYFFRYFLVRSALIPSVTLARSAL